jgi:hypothetical protein
MTRLGTLIASGIIVCAVHETFAEVLVTHPWEGQVNGFYNRHHGYTVASELTVSQSMTISQVTWSGFLGAPPYAPVPPVVGSSAAFDFVVFGNASIKPQNGVLFDHRPALEIVDEEIPAIVTGVQAVPFGPSTAYIVSYESDQLSPINMANSGTYWLSIQGRDQDPDFYWLFAHPGSPIVYGGNGAWWEDDQSDVVFSLLNDVPEPAQLPILLLTIFNLIQMRRR